MKLVKINAADYGLEENKAAEISAMFKPMLDEMVKLEKEFNRISKLNISPEACDKAHELRLKYVKVRTGTEKIHQELKRFYLLGGRFVDGWKNAQLMASQGIEEKLKAIEDHFENIEKGKIIALQNARVAQLDRLDVVAIPDYLGSMEQDIWDNYYSGIKADYDRRIEAEKKAEQEQKEAERIEQLDYDRKREAVDFAQFVDGFDDLDFGNLSEQEYKDLMEGAVQKRGAYEANQRQIQKENERLKKESEEAEKKRKADKLKQQKAQETERKNNEAILKKEQQAREKAESELQTKREAELKKEKEAAEQIEAELKKGDKEKVADLVNSLREVKTLYQFKSKSNQSMYKDVGLLIDKIISHIG